MPYAFVRLLLMSVPEKMIIHPSLLNHSCQIALKNHMWDSFLYAERLESTW